MVPVSVGVLVAMRPRLVRVLMPVMAVGTCVVTMLVLMLVFAVATHSGIHPLSLNSFYKYKH